MIDATDPFTLAEDALIHILNGYGPFNLTIKPGNRVWMAEQHARPADKTQTADMPEVALMAAGMVNDPIGATGNKAIRQSYDLMVRTDDDRMRGDTESASAPSAGTRRGLNWVKWVVLMAIERARRAAASGGVIVAAASGGIKGLDTLPGCEHFVTQVRITEATEELSTDNGLKPLGWNAVLRIELLMVFATSEVVA